jgi:hypothetical protein
VIYDERAGLGIWMIRPKAASVVAGRRIKIGWDASGWMTVRVA